MTPPGDEFWTPLGEATKFLHPEDRVRLLVDLVPLFEGSADEKEALLEVKEVLPQVRGWIMIGARDRVDGREPRPRYSADS